MRAKNETERLRAALRRGDPASYGRQPDAVETAALRTALLAEAAGCRDGGSRSSVAGRRRWATALAAAALIVATVAGLLLVRERSRDAARTSEPAALAAGWETDPASAHPRQIHFTTAGGTRVVWVLYPEDRSSDRENRQTGSGSSAPPGGVS